ncbi:LppX_LprAFG lipoprotein [Barrientosiimonas humi]|uniref:LppX_LprAFG lipoprotein n=1 Tax=Barrientosiimonas humi TaxID=999931 RepID=UPI00370D3E5B
MPMRHSRRAVAGAAALLCLSSITACSSGADSRGGGGDKSESSSATPMSRLAAAKSVVDKTSGMRIALTSEGIPQNASGLLRGQGNGSNKPNFSGTFAAKVGSIEANVPIRAIGDDVWAKLPIWPDMRKIDPKTYGAPNPATLFTPDKGLSSLMPKTRKAAFGKERRDGSEVVTPITGQLLGADVTSVLTIGDPSRVYQVEYLLTDKNELRVAKITGAFYNDATSSYILRLDQYGKKVDVQPPA